jgi:hypothetical protein
VISHPVVIDLLNLLNERRIPYLVSGSVASMYYGEPRLTHDVDLVVDIKLDQALSLVNPLGERFYISEEGIKDALEHQTMFNVIHNDTGLKIDFWILTNSKFDESRFARRIAHKIEGKSYYFSSLEDTILIKLVWFKKSGHIKHSDDIRGMLNFNKDKLDIEYLNNWISSLELDDQIKQIGLNL